MRKAPFPFKSNALIKIFRGTNTQVKLLKAALAGLHYAEATVVKCFPELTR